MKTLRQAILDEQGVMKVSLFVIAFLLAVVCTALAQGNTNESPAGEPPWALGNGKAKLIGHYGNPHQMLRLAFGLRPPNLTEEEEFLQELMTPGSPQFHKFMTADEWNARFAPSVEDEHAVLAWATSNGLTITHRYPNRLIVDAEGSVGTIEKALHIRINSYLFHGDSYFSNERAPVIPAELSGIIRSVAGLDNFPKARPANFPGTDPPGPVYLPGPVVGPEVTYAADGDGTRSPRAPGNSSSEDSVPNFTNGLIDPQNIYSSNAYNYNGLQNLGFCCNPFHVAGGSPPESSIALATFGNLHTSATPPTFPDIDGFHTTFPYLAYLVTTIPIDGGPGSCTVTSTNSCGNDLETTLDTEWSTATANSFGSLFDTAHVYVYEDGGSAEDMYNQMVTDGHALIFSTSWDNSELTGTFAISGSEMDTRHNIFNNMVGLGWTLMNSSGDAGATADCSTLDVNYPASDPDFIGVGGTQLGLFNDGSFASEVAWTGGTAPGSCSFPTNNGGSGGGCSQHFGVPGFQSGSNGTCGTQRSVPDIALNAASGQLMFFNGSSFGVGGTSIASPMVAGFFAQEGAYLLDLKSITGNTCGSFRAPCGPMGNGNTYLYYFGQNPSYPPHYPFYDIISGCDSNDITTKNNLTPFCAGIGYDSVTGWGTANMLQLAWAINTYIGGDFGAPAVNFTGPTIGHWYNTNQTVSWSIKDTSANGAVPNGVAGFSNAWDADVGDNTSEPTPGTGSSYYSGPQTALGTTGSPTGSQILDSSEEGCHTAHVRAWDNGGSTSDNTYGPVCFDNIPPVVLCGSPDGLWHASDVAIHCTGSDGLSGLANAADASFNLTTSVPVGTETSSAFTNSRTVFDVATNSTTVGPIGPNMVDKKPPSILISQPTATQYTHSSTITLSYAVTDGGSGVGTVTPTMDGSLTVGGSTITNGLTINLLTSLPLGPNTFAIKAADKVLNMSSASVTFNIIVTPQSIINDVTQFFASGAISSSGVESGLLTKLNDALAARNAGQCGTADNIYSAFINQVMAQSGKGITPAAAAILIADAQYLMAHCP